MDHSGPAHRKIRMTGNQPVDIMEKFAHDFSKFLKVSGRDLLEKLPCL